MVGDEQIWPPIQITEAISSLIYVNASTGAFPSHQVGDILVVVAVASGATPPTLPTGFESAYNSPSTDFSMAVRIGWKMATATNTSNPTWSGASWITTNVYRNADSLFPIGAVESLNTSSNTVGRAPAIIPKVQDGLSAVFASFVNNGSAGGFTMDSQPVGWLQKQRNARITTNQRLDTRTVSATTETLVGGGSVNWRGITYEVVPAQGLQHIGTISSSGATGNFASHQVGDLLVVIAQKQNTAVDFSPNTPPNVNGQTYPVYVNAYDSNISSVQGERMACKVAYGIATKSGHTTGTFTNSTWTTTMVFRNADQNNPIGDVVGSIINSNTSQSIPTPELNLQDKSGKSLTIAWIAESTTNANNNFSQNPPVGWISILRGAKRLINTAIDRKSGKSCIEVVSSTSIYWRTLAFEVKAVPLVTDVPPYLYDVAIEYAGNHVVNFTALSGFPHDSNPEVSEEAYMFRCTEVPSLNGYVAKNFTKTFPVTAYSKFNCTLQDVSGDMLVTDTKTISFTVDNK